MRTVNLHYLLIPYHRQRPESMDCSLSLRWKGWILMITWLLGSRKVQAVYTQIKNKKEVHFEVKILWKLIHRSADLTNVMTAFAPHGQTGLWGFLWTKNYLKTTTLLVEINSGSPIIQWQHWGPTLIQLLRCHGVPGGLKEHVPWDQLVCSRPKQPWIAQEYVQPSPTRPRS